MNFLKKYYTTTFRPLILSKHNITNTFNIPKIKKVDFKLKSNLKKNNKIWVILFWTGFLLTGQKPAIKKTKESASYKDTSYICVFKVSLTKTNLFSFITKYIHFMLPKMEELEYFHLKNNKNLLMCKVHGFMNHFESIEIFNFLGDSEIYLINEIHFEVNIYTTAKSNRFNITTIRGLQIPAK